MFLRLFSSLNNKSNSYRKNFTFFPKQSTDIQDTEIAMPVSGHEKTLSEHTINKQVAALRN